MAQEKYSSILEIELDSLMINLIRDARLCVSNFLYVGHGTNLAG